MIQSSQVKQQTIEAVITRADGTVVNLGVIAYYHKNPLRRLWWSIRQFVKSRQFVKAKLTRKGM